MRIENVTRWSSAYLMLESVKRAYENNVFNENFLCPVSLETIDTYLQILSPAYRISLGFQKNSSCISDVLPSLHKLIEIWENMNVPGNAKRLCKLLVLTTKNKFNYELTSPIYKVSESTLL